MEGTGTSQGLDDDRRELAGALPAYEIGEVLGRGSFAVVYAAHHIGLRRDVAVKRLSPELLSDPLAGERFATEAQTLASLDHPHVVRVHDYVEQGRVHALVMERLHGGTLAERERLGPTPLARACALTVATLHGLEHAHQHGVLHRDIKPANVLFGPHDLVKVADFGIAKVVRDSASRMTATGATLGTPAFMAPEQVSPSLGAISPATDVWAAGTMLYEMVSGELPFGSGELIEVLNRRVTEPPRRLGAVAPDVPAELADVVMRALERDPEKRWRSALAFSEALESAYREAFAEGLESAGVPIHRTASRPAGAEKQTVVETPADGKPPDRAPRDRRWLLALLAAAVTAGVAAIVLVAFSGDDGGPPAGTDDSAGGTAASTPPPAATQDGGRLSVERVEADTRSLNLTGRTVLATWSVAADGGDARDVTTCVSFPEGFRIVHGASPDVHEVSIDDDGRAACIRLELIRTGSDALVHVEGSAPRAVGTYEVTATARTGNGRETRKTSTLRIVRRCSPGQCPQE